MKVIVTKYLNVRVGEASLNAPCYQYLAPNAELEVEDDVFKGDPYEGDNRWLRDKAGNYYWIGGTSFNKPAEHPWWIRDYGIEAFWQRGLTGENIEVALLDSGVDHTHPDLERSWGTSGFNVIDEQDSTMDSTGHGTLTAGIIGGRGIWKVKGLAPKVSIMPIKVGDSTPITGNNRPVFEQRLADALDHVLEHTNARILVMALGASGKFNQSFQVEQKLNKAIKDGRIVIAAVGNNRYDYLYPAGYGEVIGVGAVKNDGHIYFRSGGNSNHDKSKLVTIMAPGVDILSSYPKSKNEEGFQLSTGTSLAAAWIAGLAALCLQAKPNLDHHSFMNLLVQSAKRIESTDEDGQFGNGIIQPQKLIHNL